MEPPNGETMPSLETTPTPQEPPTTAASVGDNPPPQAGLVQSSRVVKPVPVNAITMANTRVEARNVDHNAASGGVGSVRGVSVGVRGGELPVDYGSVNLMSPPPQPPPLVNLMSPPPQPPPSAFLPAPAQVQQVQLQRTHSLPVQQHQGIYMWHLYVLMLNVDGRQVLCCTTYNVLLESTYQVLHKPCPFTLGV